MSRAPTLARKLLNSTMKMKNETPLVTVPPRPSLRKYAFYGICLLAALSLAAVQAEATLIYDNGPINGTAGGYTISPPYSVSDSFTVTGSASLGSAQSASGCSPVRWPLRSVGRLGRHPSSPISARARPVS